jgi:Protein of unknown function (DUF3037)
VSASGSYSVVQYIEDLERGEALNVGVLLAGSGGICARFEEREELRASQEVVDRFSELVNHLIAQEVTCTGRDPVDFLSELAARRFSHFGISTPRLIELDDDPGATLEQLAQRLVGDSVSANC